MAITLGRDGALSPSFGTDIISVSKTSESEQIDVSNRTNSTGNYRVFLSGFTNETWEVECHDATGLITEIGNDTSSGYTVTNVTENINLDGPVTFTVTIRNTG